MVCAKPIRAHTTLTWISDGLEITSKNQANMILPEGEGGVWGGEGVYYTC